MSRVTDAVMQRVSDAIATLEADNNRRRTKRAIEEISGLSHDAVARAFRQDSDDGSRWNLSEHFAELTSAGTTRLAPFEQEVDQLRQQLAERDAEIRRLNAQIQTFAQIAYAQRLAIEALQDPHTAEVIPLLTRQAPVADS